jgi:hypothetical protein
MNSGDQVGSSNTENLEGQFFSWQSRFKIFQKISTIRLHIWSEDYLYAMQALTRAHMATSHVHTVYAYQWRPTLMPVSRKGIKVDYLGKF